MGNKKTKEISLSLLLVFFVGGSGCRFMRVERGGLADSTEEGGSAEEEGQGSTTGIVALTQNVSGFGSWGGIARSERYIHMSDPSALVSSDPDSQSDTFSGASGLNPSEILPTGKP